MTPYLEVRVLPPDRRRWLVILAAALLVAPVGALLPGADSTALQRGAALVVIVLVAPLLGLGLARPREMITVDADAATITRRTVGELPDPRATVETWPITQARHVALEELGTPHHPRWGVRIELDGDAPVELSSYADRDLAQDTVDHLVLLGIPGLSRAELRARQLTAEPPPVWL